MNFLLTSHAIQRYVDRIAPGLDYAAAEAALLAAIEHAVRTKDKSAQGHFLWKVESPPMRLVTKRDGNHDVVVTVLLPHEQEFPEELEHLQELLREREEYLALRRQTQTEQIKVLVEKKQEIVANAAAKGPMRSSKVSIHVPSELEAQIKVLAMELQIMNLEIAPIKEREKSVRTLRCEDYRYKAAKEALRLAVQALKGDISTADALAGIEALEPGLVTPEFYQLRGKGTKRKPLTPIE